MGLEKVKNQHLILRLGWRGGYCKSFLHVVIVLLTNKISTWSRWSTATLAGTITQNLGWRHAGRIVKSAHLNILRKVESLRGPAEVGRHGRLQLPGCPVLGAAGGCWRELEDPPDLVSLGLHSPGHRAEGELSEKYLSVFTELRELRVLTHHNHGEQELALQVIVIVELRQSVQALQGLQSGLGVELSIFPHQSCRPLVVA